MHNCLSPREKKHRLDLPPFTCAGEKDNARDACVSARLAFARGEKERALTILETVPCEAALTSSIVCLHRAEFQIATGNTAEAINDIRFALYYSDAPHHWNFARRLLNGIQTPEETETFLSKIAEDKKPKGLYASLSLAAHALQAQSRMILKV